MTNSEAVKPQLVRSSVLLKEETDQALRKLADAAGRPLSWEIRFALERHVAKASNRLPVKGEVS